MAPEMAPEMAKGFSPRAKQGEERKGADPENKGRSAARQSTRELKRKRDENTRYQIHKRKSICR